MSSSPTRRYFISSSVGAAAALSAAGAAFAADPAAPGAKPGAPAKKKEAKKPRAADSIPSPGEKINMAVIGCGGRGGSHMSDLLGLSDHANVVAVCDPDEAHAGKFAQTVEEESGTAPQSYTDVRKMLENKEIQAVTIATPNHWHALAAIWAIQAGKDVYVEKPCSHNVAEGRRLVEFARKYNRVVLHGTQSRSSRAMNQAMDFIHAGGLGKVFLARGTCYKRRQSIGQVGNPLPVPQGVDYDLWCGPAPMNPIKRKKFHYDWHWIWDYGNGDIGNQGVHQMDIALWGLDKRELPKRVQTIGGRFGYVDDGETPNTEVSVLDYDDCKVIFEVRGLETKPPRGAKNGVANIFYGTEGSLVVHDYNKCVAYAPDGTPIEMPTYEGDASGNHFVTFIKAVKSRKLDFNRGEIEVGHLGSAMCHLANISYRLGEPAQFDKKRGAFGDDRAAYATLARTEEHLTENGLKLEETNYMLGPSLDFDPEAERFTNNEKANAMLTREYRKPYVVPDKVV